MQLTQEYDRLSRISSIEIPSYYLVIISYVVSIGGFSPSKLDATELSCAWPGLPE
jgi:hypothetical protein